jgi:hypothetical protein
VGHLGLEWRSGAEHVLIPKSTLSPDGPLAILPAVFDVSNVVVFLVDLVAAIAWLRWLGPFGSP